MIKLSDLSFTEFTDDNGTETTVWQDKDRTLRIVSLDDFFVLGTKYTNKLANYNTLAECLASYNGQFLVSRFPRTTEWKADLDG